MTTTQARLERAFLTWIHGDTFTCLGARAASRRRDLVVRVYPSLCEPADATARLHQDLLDFAVNYLAEGERDFASFVAIFASPVDLTEVGFEQALWDQLGRLHRRDAPAYPWAVGFAADPSAPNFAFSVGSHPFFVAGLNPAASRISRRFDHPALIFNSHEQFARLKASGVYQRLQRKIRAKEMTLQGCVNPMLLDHGVASEAPQYSGRAVGETWECPFRPLSP